MENREPRSNELTPWAKAGARNNRAGIYRRWSPVKHASAKKRKIFFPMGQLLMVTTDLLLILNCFITFDKVTTVLEMPLNRVYMHDFLRA